MKTKTATSVAVWVRFGFQLDLLEKKCLGYRWKTCNFNALVRYIFANVIKIIRNNRVVEEVRMSYCTLKAKVDVVGLPVLHKLAIFWRFSSGLSGKIKYLKAYECETVR